MRPFSTIRPLTLVMLVIAFGSLGLGRPGTTSAGDVTLAAAVAPALATPSAVVVAALATNKEAVRRVYEIFSSGDVASAEVVIAPTWVNHSPAFAGLPTGAAGFVQLVTFFRTAFPDLTITVDDLVAEGDRVAARYTVRGTHQGPLGDVPATGQSVEVQAIDVFRVVDGRVTDVWPIVDQLTLLTQIGVFPPAGNGTPTP